MDRWRPGPTTLQRWVARHSTVLQWMLAVFAVASLVQLVIVLRSEGWGSFVASAALRTFCLGALLPVPRSVARFVADHDGQHGHDRSPQP